MSQPTEESYVTASTANTPDCADCVGTRRGFVIHSLGHIDHYHACRTCSSNVRCFVCDPAPTYLSRQLERMTLIKRLRDDVADRRSTTTKESTHA